MRPAPTGVGPCGGQSVSPPRAARSRVVASQTVSSHRTVTVLHGCRIGAAGSGSVCVGGRMQISRFWRPRPCMNRVYALDGTNRIICQVRSVAGPPAGLRQRQPQVTPQSRVSRHLHRGDHGRRRQGWSETQQPASRAGSIRAHCRSACAKVGGPRDSGPWFVLRLVRAAVPHSREAALVQVGDTDSDDLAELAAVIAWGIRRAGERDSLGRRERDGCGQ